MTHRDYIELILAGLRDMRTNRRDRGLGICGNLDEYLLETVGEDFEFRSIPPELRMWDVFFTLGYDAWYPVLATRAEADKLGFAPKSKFGQNDDLDGHYADVPPTQRDLNEFVYDHTRDVWSDEYGERRAELLEVVIKHFEGLLSADVPAVP
jgi:hypothetical protein